MAVSVKEEFGGSAQSSGRAYDWEYGDGGSEGVTTDTVYLPMARFNRKNIVVHANYFPTTKWPFNLKSLEEAPT